MKYAKMLGLLAVAAAALMAFAGTASAAQLTSPTGTGLGVGTTIEASSSNSKLDGSVVLSCSVSTVKGKITETGGAAVVGTVESLTFSSCGNNTVSVLNKGHAGTLSIDKNGTVTSTGAEVTALTHNILGTVHCIYKTNNTDVGSVTDSHDTGGNAVLDIGSAGIPEVATDTFACKDDAVWTGNYTVSNPSTLYVD